MAVYVDDMNLPADVANGSKVVSSSWSHLMADSHEELMAAAAKLRLNPKWIQYPGTPKEHFDLTSGKRAQAIHRQIAEPITWRQSGELYAAKVQAQQAQQAQAERERLDRAAGMAYREGEFGKAREILAEAMGKHPGQSQLWTSRLARVEEAAGKSRPQPSPLPEPGVHRDGGTTTAGRFGLFDRAPDPGPEHYCPGCTSYSERDGKTYVHGPKIAEDQAECQGCGVLRSMGLPVPRETEPQAVQIEAGA
jgi:hypothetical protein